MKKKVSHKITIYAISFLCIFILFSCNKRIKEIENGLEKSLNLNQTELKKLGTSPYYYYYKGEKLYLELNPEYVFITTTNEQLHHKGGIVEEYSVVRVNRDDWLNPKINGGQKNIYSAELKSAEVKNEKNYFLSLEKLKTKEDIETVSPYFKTKTGNKLRLTNAFYVKLNSIGEYNILKQLADKNKAIILRQNKFMPLWYTLSVTKQSMMNALEMANYFSETKLFAEAQPDLISDNIGASLDPYYSSQWNLQNTGQYGGSTGIDIGLGNTHNYAKGQGVVVAVIDEGVQLNHPDLSANIYSQSYDATTGTSPSIVYGGHGTACAGVIAADDNNIGVLGIAPDSKIMSASVNWRSGSAYVNDWFADAINWSWQNGADVISNSWGGGSPNALIDDAITNALMHGRSGKGCVVAFSTHNHNSSIAYPANSNPEIISVGAISYCGQRKSFWSCDAEPWGSNYGPELDVVAPGVRVLTTYVTGTGDNGGDYSIWFNGTSAACPHIAGIAALLLSKEPDLRGSLVRDIIEASSKKINPSSYAYSSIPSRYNGLWNTEMGYGLVDAYSAIQNIPSLTYFDFNNLIKTSVTMTLSRTDGPGSFNFSIEEYEAAIFHGIPTGLYTISIKASDGKDHWLGGNCIGSYVYGGGATPIVLHNILINPTFFFVEYIDY